MSELHRKPRAFLIATLTSTVLAVQYLVFDWVGWQLQNREVGDGGFVSQVVFRAANPFYGGIFRSRLDADTVVPWLVGFASALAVVWLVVLIVCRKGSLAAFVGTWFATMAGGCVAALGSSYLWARTNDLAAGYPRTQILTYAFDRGLHWGFLFGWLPALVAALLAGVLRRRRAVRASRSRVPVPDLRGEPVTAS